MILKNRTGAVAVEYKAAVALLNNATNLNSVPGLDTQGKTSGYCAHTIKHIFGEAKVSCTEDIAEAENAVALGKACRNHPEIFESYSSAPITQIPDGALCFWDNLGEGNGHVAFVMSDGNSRYILGNTNGILKVRNLGGIYSHPTSWVLPISK